MTGVGGGANLRMSLLPMLHGIRAGDDRLSTPLVRAMETRVRAWVWRRLRGRPEVESWIDDVVQDVMLRLWRGLDQVDALTEGEFVGWIKTVTRREVASWMRDSLPAIRAEATMGAWQFSSDTPLGEASTEFRRRLKVLEAAYASLSPQAQQLLYVRLVTGASWLEVGEEMGTTESGARRRGQRAQTRLRKAVEHPDG